jgi:ADP-ribosylglycohydrolase
MLGAIIGDIVGSVYEWNNIKTKDFPLFTDKCFFTDDTIMTIAVADALLNGETITYGGGIDSYSGLFASADEYINSMKKWGRLYPDGGYGGNFRRWLFSDDRNPYNSWGNGSAMRVSPCGWAIPLQQFIRIGFDGVLSLAKQSAEVTHNHPEGIRGAQATAMAIYYARHGKIHGDIETYKNYLRRDLGNNGDSSFGDIFNYDLNRTLDKIRPTYRFNESCQETVPEAIIAFLESTDFEDAIRNAISLGGDSDTLAAITGSIAEAAYGIPKDIADKALVYLDAPLREVYERWCEAMPENR